MVSQLTKLKLSVFARNGVQQPGSQHEDEHVQCDMHLHV